MIPSWLHLLSICSLIAAAVCALVIAIDLLRRPQTMWIMNIVWPVAALFGSVLWLWGYWHYGRAGGGRSRTGSTAHQPKDAPFSVLVATAASHCGSGCTLGDICAEWLAFAAPGVLGWVGWGSMFSERTYAVWTLDFIFAFAIGIVFQYFTIAPMRNLGFAEGLWAALKADTLSLLAWQLGMYGFMAIAIFWLFPAEFGVLLAVDSPEFWFAMQIAMLCGFATAFPVNWWLIKTGWKEKM